MSLRKLMLPALCLLALSACGMPQPVVSKPFPNPPGNLMTPPPATLDLLPLPVPQPSTAKPTAPSPSS